MARKAAKGQREFDFDALEAVTPLREAELAGDWKKLRGRQLDILDNCAFEAFSEGERADGQGKRVPADRLQHVLKGIDSFSRGRGPARVRLDTLAKRCNLKTRTLKRVLEVLEKLGLIIRDHSDSRRGWRGANVTAYTIVWSQLALKDRRRQTGIRADQRATWGRSTGHVETINGPRGDDQWAIRGPQEALYEALYETPPPPAPQWQVVLEEEVYRLGVDQAREAIAAAIANGCIETVLRAVIAHWQTLEGLKNPAGALCRKLEKMRPGDPVERGFPKSKAKSVSAARCTVPPAKEPE